MQQSKIITPFGHFAAEDALIKILCTGEIDHAKHHVIDSLHMEWCGAYLIHAASACGSAGPHLSQRFAGAPLKPVIAHWLDANGIEQALQGECVLTETG